MVYFEVKITTQDEGDMCHHMIDELTVVKYQVDETQFLIEYIVPYVTV